MPGIEVYRFGKAATNSCIVHFTFDYCNSLYQILEIVFQYSQSYLLLLLFFDAHKTGHVIACSEISSPG